MQGGVDVTRNPTTRPLSWGLQLPGLLRERRVLGILALALVYRGAAEVGYQLQFAGPVAAIVWLPVGAGVAFLYLAGLRFWPGILIGDLLANDYRSLPLGSGLGQSCGNVLEVVVITLLLRRLAPGGGLLHSVGGVGRVLAAIGAGVAISAIVGPCSLLLGGAISADELVSVSRTWWLGDACGALIVLPLVLAWADPASRGWLSRHGFETLLMLTTVAALSQIAFRSSRPLTYLVFPVLIWAALRLRQRGATAAVAVAAGIAIWETTREVGPFVYGSSADRVLSAQVYLAITALSALFLAAVVSEREAFAERLAASRARLVEIAVGERRRLGRDLHDGAQQRLTALLVHLRLVSSREREMPASAVVDLKAAEHELQQAIDELRELAHGVLPPVLVKHGLARALREMASHAAFPIDLVELPQVRVDPTAEATAYFVVSEAVTNVRKHARAASVSVCVTAFHGGLRIEVADDGVGGANEQAGAGLQGLRDRVEAIGGTFELVSGDRRGTRIVGVLPATPRPS